MGEKAEDALQLQFDRRLRLEFQGATITSDAGLLACRELDEPLDLPKAVKDWSLRSLQLKLIKIGGRVVRHARRIAFQLAEVAVPRDLFALILERLTQLRLAPG